MSPLSLRMSFNQRLKRLVDERREEADKGHDIRFMPNYQDFHWLMNTTNNIDPLFKACNINLKRYKDLKATLRNLATEHFSLDASVEDQSFKVHIVITDALQTHCWLDKYENYWPARLYITKYWKAKCRSYFKKKNLARSSPEVALLRPVKRRIIVSPSVSDEVNNNSSERAPTISSSETDDADHVACQAKCQSSNNAEDIASPGSVLNTPSSRATTLPHDGSTTLTATNAMVPNSTMISGTTSFPFLESDNNTKISTGRDVVKDFLQSARPPLGAYLDGFLMLGIHDEATLRAFLAWPRQVQLQWLNDENRMLRMTRLEIGSFLVHCENAAGCSLSGNLMRQACSN
ncbi:hypothetical protein V8B97DRAFT_1940021 [Scleroderma yunnanense]